MEVEAEEYMWEDNLSILNRWEAKGLESNWKYT